VSGIMPELAGKRLELLRELFPKLSRLAFLAYRGDPAHGLFVKEAQDAAQSFGIQFQSLVIASPDEIEGAFSAMARERAGALVVQPLFVGSLGQGRRIADLAVQNRVPTVSDLGSFADAGGLISYGPDVVALYRRAATYVDKILKAPSLLTSPSSSRQNLSSSSISKQQKHSILQFRNRCYSGRIG
jgi:ABC-type uncharacterized transport system substrate-binding protein